ncbi:MAG TPA: flagellar basal body P-ring protein FlgI [Terracidiphilus sp.]|jgi:flagellar P-ring protein precursor FlgI|nr:flagellar basal body P-ring protein FlgI [Terracidiphilus sp.]
MKMRSVFATTKFRLLSTIVCALALSATAFDAPHAAADNKDRHVLVRDITTIEGVRDNMLVGYGLVVGLNRTGDSQQTFFTVQTLANAMQKMGVLIAPGQVEVKNVASVFITASLPPFARPGERLDVTVSSVGDAKSLVGGVLLMSALHGPDGQIYVEAQGPLVMGGYTAGNGLNGKEVNSTTVGTIANGGIVERDTSVDLHDFKTVSLLLRNPDFTTASRIADAVNQEFHKQVASVLDSRRVDVNVADAGAPSVPLLISRVENLPLNVNTPAKIVINERTGTIVLGGEVKLSPVAVIHGNLSIEVSTTYTVAPIPGAIPGFTERERPAGGGQPGGPGAPGQNPGEPGGGPGGGQGGGQGGGFDRSVQGNPTAALVPQTTLNVTDAPAQTMRLDQGANVEELVNGLHALGATSHDVVAILEAIKAEGGIQADLEVQ